MAGAGNGDQFGGGRRVSNAMLKVRGDIDRDRMGVVTEAEDGAGAGPGIGIGADGSIREGMQAEMLHGVDVEAVLMASVIEVGEKVDGGGIVDPFGLSSVFVESGQCIRYIEASRLLQVLEGADKRPVEIVGLVESNIVGCGWRWVVEIDRVECVPRGEVTRCIGVRGWDIFSVEALDKGNLI